LPDTEQGALNKLLKCGGLVLLFYFQENGEREVSSKHSTKKEKESTGLSRREVIGTGLGLAVGGAIGWGIGTLTAPTPEEPEVTQSEVEDFLNGASESQIREIVGATVPGDILAELSTQPRSVTLAIEHFSIIEGTTWSGAHHRGGTRLVERYPWLEYVWDEEIGPDETITVARDFIDTQEANIIVANAGYMGTPFKEIADEFPDVYFVIADVIVDPELVAKRNILMYLPRHYQAVYLEGLVAGELSQTNNIGIVSAMPNVSAIMRQNAFFLGVKHTNPEADVFAKFVGGWYDPPTEAEVARTLVEEANCDVLTQQTDSSAPLTVAVEEGIWFIGKDMDIQQLGWGDDSTIAVSFDTRWEVGYDLIIKEFMANSPNLPQYFFVGMNTPMILEDGTTSSAVDLQNGGRIGIDEISPEARPLISDETMDLIEDRRNLLLTGTWDPWLEEFRSNGTGLDLPGLPVPPKGTVVKAAGEMPTLDWLFTSFNFDLEGMTILGE